MIRSVIVHALLLVALVLCIAGVVTMRPGQFLAAGICAIVAIFVAGSELVKETSR